MGDAHRIPKSKDKKFSDSCSEELLRIEPAKLNHKLSPFFTNSAYRYTKAEVGEVK